MADLSDGTYVVECLTISFGALKVFSSLLPSPASDIVEQAQDIVAHLRRIPASRHEIARFQSCLLKSLPVVLTVFYELTIGDQDPPKIPAESRKHFTRFERALNEIRNKFSSIDSTAPLQPGLPRVKKGLLVAIPKPSLLQNSINYLQWAVAPFGVSCDNDFVVDAYNPYKVETNFIYAARLSTIARKALRFTPDPVLETLPRAQYARFDCERPDRPASCLKGTRIGIIKDTIEWITFPGQNAKRFFWLKGLAGTGKTTIAHSIATIARNLGILGASFLFSRRGQAELRDPARVFPTIAYQLALFDPKFHNLITAALKAEPQAPTASLKRQLDSLIIEPLSQLQRDDQRIVIIVFDAFDECEIVGAKTILQLLVDAISSLPFFLKIFVTSRPELHVRSVLIPSNENLQITALHEIKSSVVQSDILLYLRTEIRELPGKKDLALPEDWITDVQIELLAHAAGELFIYAKTLLRSLEEAYSLPDQLDSLLKLATRPRTEDDESNPFAYLDELYLEVLRGPVTRSNKAQVLKLLQVVLGTIILLRDPLPIDALERLTGMRNGNALATLNSLHSVILPAAHPDYCLRTYHKSFPDFLQDPERCTDPGSFIDTQKHETRIAIHCLQLLNAKLHEGMLEDLDPTLLNSEVRDLGNKVDDAILAELRYACCHWASHVANVCSENAVIKIALEEFTSKKMLAWMESLGWLGSTSSGITCLEKASTWAAKSGVSERIIRLLHEGRNLILAHGDSIELSSQHVRQFVLPFAPLNGALASRYSSFADTDVRLIQGFDSAWPSSLTVSTGHARPVTSITFSPGSSRLASTSSDSTVRLWDATTGTSTAALSGHSGEVTSITFSPDGTRLASGSHDNTVRFWDVTTGNCIATLNGHSDWVRSVIFSPDGARLASGSWDHTVRLWDATTGACTATLEGHYGEIRSVMFSPDGTQLASGSDDHTVRLWETITGNCTAILGGHSGYVNAVAFSPDGTRLASGSWDKTVQLWDATTGVCTATLEGHSRTVTSVTFSPDGSRIQSQDILYQTIIWNIRTGDPAEHLDRDEFNHGSNNSIGAFKHENRKLCWVPRHGPERLICLLPPGTDSKTLVSRRLREGVEAVAIGCATGRVIIMHVQVPCSTGTR